MINIFSIFLFDENKAFKLQSKIVSHIGHNVLKIRATGKAIRSNMAERLARHESERQSML